MNLTQWMDLHRNTLYTYTKHFHFAKRVLHDNIKSKLWLREKKCFLSSMKKNKSELTHIDISHKIKTYNSCVNQAIDEAFEREKSIVHTQHTSINCINDGNKPADPFVDELLSFFIFRERQKYVYRYHFIWSSRFKYECVNPTWKQNDKKKYCNFSLYAQKIYIFTWCDSVKHSP